MKSGVVINEIMSPDEKYIIFMDDLIDIENKKNYGDIWENFENLKFFLRYSFNHENTPVELREEANLILNKTLLSESVSEITQYKEIISEFLNEAKLWDRFKDWAKETGKSTVSGIKDFVKTSAKGISSVVDKIANAEWMEVVELLKKGTVYVLKKLRDAVYSPIGMILETILVLTGIGKVPQAILWGLIVGLDIYEIISGDYEGTIFSKILDTLFDVFAMVATGSAAKVMKKLFKGIGSTEDLVRLLKSNKQARSFFEKIPQMMDKLKGNMSKVVSFLADRYPKGAKFLKNIIAKIDSFKKQVNKFVSDGELALTGASVATSRKEELPVDLTVIFESEQLNESLASLLGRAGRSVARGLKRVFINADTFNNLKKTANLDRASKLMIDDILDTTLSSKERSKLIKKLIQSNQGNADFQGRIADILTSDIKSLKGISKTDLSKSLKKAGMPDDFIDKFLSKLDKSKGKNSGKVRDLTGKSIGSKIRIGVSDGFKQPGYLSFIRGKMKKGEALRWLFSGVGGFKRGAPYVMSRMVGVALRNWLVSSITLTLIKSVLSFQEEKKMTDAEMEEYFSKSNTERLLIDIKSFFENFWTSAGLGYILPITVIYKWGEPLILSIFDILKTESFDPTTIKEIIEKNMDLKEKSEEDLMLIYDEREEILNSSSEYLINYINANPDSLSKSETTEDRWILNHEGTSYLIEKYQNKWMIVSFDEKYYYSLKDVKKK